MMSSCNNDYSSGNNNSLAYSLSPYLSSVSGHQEIIHYSNQLTAASPGQMVSAVPASLVNFAVSQQGFEFPEVSNEIKKVVKKDRHSKIYTAQGLRDRRVRLSIGIARQFFDLQDMLGFDKASKTLDWLLKKSEKAIKEIVQTKSLNKDDKDEEEEDDDDDEYCEEEEVKKAEKRKKKSKLSNISPKPSRAKGKAKERTREIVYDHPETVSKISQSEIMDPFKSSIIFNEGEDMMTHCFYKEAIEEFNNQEPILTNKSKITVPTNMSHSYNQHNGTFIMTDQSSRSNYNIIMPQILDYSYDQNTSVDQTFCAVTNTNFPRGFP